MKLSVLLSAWLTACLCLSCRYDKAKEVKPNDPEMIALCDTSVVVSYSAQIVPIISEHCISCHGVTDQTKLHDYSHVKAKALATSGSLYSAITADGSAIPMPPNTAKLSVCDIQKIKKWIDAGTPNN